MSNESVEHGGDAPRPKMVNGQTVMSSTTRTKEGEEWAKSVGGEVPPRGGRLLSARQMQGMIDFSRQ